MIGFGREEIIMSVLYALVFGAGLCMVRTMINTVFEIFPLLRQMIICAVKFDKILDFPKINLHHTSKNRPVWDFFAVILFSLSFMLLSYYSLDGQIRLYMIFCVFAAFYLSKIAFFGFLESLFSKILCLIFSLLSVLLRILILPFTSIFLKFFKQFNHTRT